MNQIILFLLIALAAAMMGPAPIKEEINLVNNEDISKPHVHYLRVN